VHGAIDFLNQVIFSLGGTPVMLSEIMGFVLGVVTVWLVAKNNVWTYPIGIIQAGFFFVLFIETKLYTDAYLQVFFIVVQFIGWYAWLRGGENHTELHVRNAPLWVWPVILVLGGIFVYLMIPILRGAHGAYPGWDSTTTALSVAAQFLMTFRYVQQWWLWILADVIYIPLYFNKDLYFTSILYVIFLGISIYGLYTWTKLRQHQAENPVIRPKSAPVFDDGTTTA
jgi:nicotinamide mononucleotide transporter